MQIPLSKPIINEEMKNAAFNALQNEKFVLGESVFKFEEEFAKYCGTDHAVSISSGTDALQLALIGLGIKGKDSVITSPTSFIASSNAVLHVGATPVFSDIEIATYTIDPMKITKAIRIRTRAVMPIHLYGYPADIDPINEIAKKKRLYVVEDACQAHGALYKNRKIGNLSDVACFSFYPSKNMTVAGDGGMIVTNNEQISKKVAKLRNCGRLDKYVHDIIGYTARLNTINAAIGRIQLKKLNEWNEKRQKNAQSYNRLLSDIDELILPPKGDREIKPVYHLYVIRTKHRDKLKEWLETNKIQCGIHYQLPIHLQPIYRKIFDFKKGLYPKSEEVCKTCLSIPIYPELRLKEINFISEKIHDFFTHAPKEKTRD